MRTAAVLIELIGISTVATGIGMELAYGGALHLIVITTGSCIVAIGAVIYGKFVRGHRGK